MKLKNNTLNYFLLLLLLPVLFSACRSNENPQPAKALSADSARALEMSSLSDKIRQQFGDTLAVVETGFFQDDSSLGAAAGFNISKPADLFIKFVYLKNVDGGIQRIAESPLLKGSFNGGLVRKMKLAGSTYDVLYYDSQSYFLGSRGGEVFAHVADFNKNKFYTAHFFTVPERPVSLYLSPGIDNPEIRDLFVKHFKKDYPELKIVNRDYNLEGN